MLQRAIRRVAGGARRGPFARTAAYSTSLSTGRFDKILVANRGEIACRVLKTANRMGIRTVAVYSEADAGSKHVQMADEAYCIGPPPAAQSYLMAERIAEVAIRSGAQGIHPGYGFLSENAEFADLLSREGITFIGPPASAIRAMGSKSESKRIMSSANVPVVPGYHDSDQSVERLQKEADIVGFPVLIKAIYGGGGKGMKIAMTPDEFHSALDSAKREAMASFGNDDVLIERYLTKPRHIEFQVFADTHGNCVHLFERDCSVQRRHQKVLEESPAPGLSEEQRDRMGQSAVDAAKAVGYVGAGTVEFIAEDDTYFFMEMNTRLQVEHPVTEAVTGQDLVEWQLRVAAGEPLPMQQSQLQLCGHAIEARVYAEAPNKGFLPQTGKLHHLKPPTESQHVRVDSGVRQGDEVSVYYDPMIAKLIVHDEDRTSALKRMMVALRDYEMSGLSNNLDFLHKCVSHPQFVEGGVTTAFIENNAVDLIPEEGAPPPHISETSVALAAFYIMASDAAAETISAAASRDRTTPWSDASLAGRWFGGERKREFDFTSEDGLRVKASVFASTNTDELRVEVMYDGEEKPFVMTIKGQISSDGSLAAELDGKLHKCTATKHGQQVAVFEKTGSTVLNLASADFGTGGEAASAGAVKTPMPGKVVKIHVAQGEAVTAGQPLMILEAMKMEHIIKAPFDGKVESTNFNAGDLVQDGQTLLVVGKDE